MAKKNKNTASVQETPATNQATTRFERVFYRYLAWFPIIVLPVLVVDMFGSGQYAVGGIVALIHVVLVFRFVQVVNVPALFRKKAPGA